MSKDDFNKNAGTGAADEKTRIEQATDALLVAVRRLDFNLSLSGDPHDPASDAGKSFQAYRDCLAELQAAVDEKVSAGPKLDKAALIRFMKNGFGDK